MADPNIAIECVERGWSLVPLNGKVPTEKEWTKLPPTSKDQALEIATKGNFGIRTGVISNLVVIDIDPKNGGFESLEQLPRCFHDVPYVHTGSGGLHYYFQYPKQGTLRNSSGKLGPGIDVRADGGQVVAPSSLHPETQVPYAWGSQPYRELPEFPDELYSLLTTTPSVEYNEGESIPEGQRDTFLTSIAGSMRRRGMSEEAIYAALTVENQRCAPPKASSDLRRIAKSVSRYQPEDPIMGEVSVKSGAQVAHQGIPVATAETRLPGESPLIHKNHSRLSLPSLLSFEELKTIEVPDIEVIPTPLSFLNKFMAGGFGLSELIFLIAKQESGKSSLACACAAHAVKQGYKALVVHYEDSFRALKKRYTTLLGNSHHLSDVYFLNAVDHKIGIPEIARAIEQHKPSFVVIDYFSRIPGPTTNKGAESRFESKAIAELLKDIAVANNCAILVTDHVTILQQKTGNPYRIYDYMVAEAKQYKLAIVDTMIGLARDLHMGQRLYLSGMKMKREYTGDTRFWTFNVDWSECRFYE